MTWRVEVGSQERAVSRTQGLQPDHLGQVLALPLPSDVTPGSLAGPAYSLGYCKPSRQQCMRSRSQGPAGPEKADSTRQLSWSQPVLHGLGAAATGTGGPHWATHTPIPSPHPSLDWPWAKWEGAGELCTSTYLTGEFASPQVERHCKASGASKQRIRKHDKRKHRIILNSMTWFKTKQT